MTTTSTTRWVKSDAVRLDWEKTRSVTTVDGRTETKQVKVVLTLPGHVRDNLAVVKAPDGQGWRIAHQPSGMSPGIGAVGTRKAAQEIADYILDKLGPALLDKAATVKGKRGFTSDERIKIDAYLPTIRQMAREAYP